MEQKYLTKVQVSDLIKGAPPGVTPESIVKDLVEKRGYTLEGFTPPQTKGQETLSDIKQISSDIGQTLNKGMDKVDATVKAYQSGEQGTLKTAYDLAGAGAGTVSKALFDSLKGVVKSILPQSTENDINQYIGKVAPSAINTLSKYEELQKTNPLKAKIVNLALAGTPNAAMNIKMLVDGYEKLKTTNPSLARSFDATLGFASLFGDLAGIGEAGKLAQAGIKTGMEATSGLAKGVGEAATKTVSKGVGKVFETGKSVTNVVGEVIPSAERAVNYQVTRALDLTQGDVKNIAKSTGHEVGQFLAEKNLIGNGKEATNKLLSDFYDTNYQAVRKEIASVNKTYKPTKVASYKQALGELQKQISNVPGLEKSAKEVSSLLKKEKITLEDVQRVKELMDEHFNLYKVTGDVRESIAKEGLANIRSELRGFIEKEVKSTTKADISELNNNVATSKSILNAIEDRSTRGLTTSNIKMGDLGVFGAGSIIGTPLTGAALLIAKKIIESPTIRLRFARWLDALSDAKKLRIAKTLAKGDVPEEVSKVTQDIGSLGKQIPKNKTIDNPMNTPISTSIPKTVKKSSVLLTEAKKYKSAEEYMYHGTSEGAFRKIREKGLIPEKISSDTQHVYFGDKEARAKYYAGAKGGNVYGERVLRVKKTPDMKADPRMNIKGDFRTEKAISPENIEIKINGKWKPIQDYFDESINIMPIKTRSQLTNIYNKAKVNGLKVKGTIPENSLISEAKKYKSAEEFVKAQGAPVYHGTNTKFDVFDKTKIGEATGTGDWGDGFYFSDSKDVARSFAKDAGGDVVMEVNLKNLKFADGNKLEKLPEVQNILDDGMGFADIGEYVKLKGYDGVKYKHSGDGGVEYVVYDADKIKTKSQLTDIWKKANNK